MENQHSDNPNPHAKIAFVIYYPFQFYVYKDVYEKLEDQAEFVIDLGAFFPNRQTEDVLPALEMLLAKHGAHYRVFQYEDYYYAKYFERFFSQYEMLVSVWWRGSITYPRNALKKKVHMTYGAGKELTQFSLQKNNFDLILAYGEYDNTFYSSITQSVITGNPKFDDWFKDTIDMESVSDVVKRLDQKKKTILYLPTHSDLSSIKDLAGDLKKITDEYNVIAKLHYYTPREEPDLATLLENPRILLLKDDTDLLPLLKVADVVVSDNSSAIFDAVLADRPIVVADFYSAEHLDAEHREVRTYRRGQGAALTYSGSIEQRIKRDGTVHTITKPGELRDRIAEVLAHDDKCERRRALSQQLFSFRDGKSGERAAVAIRELMEKGAQERPFMYHALKHYTTSALRRPWRSDRQSVQAEESIIVPNGTGIVFSVIILPCNPEYRSQALRSIHEQDFPKEQYELVELPEGETLGVRVASAVAKSSGKVICFTTEDCVPPSDWLSSLYAAYERHPSAGGVGGYMRTAREHYTPYDEYYYYELGKKLGVERERWFLRKVYEVENQVFSQNPAGDLRNISYRKDLVSQSITHMAHVQNIEIRIKAEVMQAHPLCFIPIAVIESLPTTLSGLFGDVHERGFFHQLERRNIRSLGSYDDMRSVTFADALRVLVHRRDISRAAIFFLGRVAWLLGRLRGLLVLIIVAANLKLQDRLKTSATALEHKA